MKKLEQNVIDNWYRTIEEGGDDFLDFMQGLHINECVKENGERVIYIEDGNYYIAHGYRLGELDGEKEKAIIDYYEECGGNYE